MYRKKMKKLKNVCVFCGHASGNDAAYVEAAQALGRHLAQQGVGLVYGGGGTGLMGAVAKATLDAGGDITGITTPIISKKEIPLPGTYFETMPNLQERKRRMIELSDAFCALPGGMGTLDEVSEIFTLHQIGTNTCSIVLLNVLNYWEHWIKMVDVMIQKGFASQDHSKIYSVVDDPNKVVPTLLKRL